MFFSLGNSFLRNMGRIHIFGGVIAKNEFFGTKCRTIPTMLKSGSSSNRFVEKNDLPSREPFKPKNKNQKLYCQYLKDSNVKIVVGVGPAGSGKTLFACAAAIKELCNNNINKIVITRPLISVDEENLGFLPGSLTDKMDPWARPIIDIFQEYYSLQEINSMFASGKIEIAPLAYMRGRTFKKSIIIADEMQNSSPNQMLMLATRIGEESKLCITGDLDQTDRHGVNGLMDFINKVKYWELKDGFHEGMLETKSRNIEIIEFEKKDIERSPIVSKIMEIYSLKPTNLTFLAEASLKPKMNSSPFLSPSLSGKSYSEVTANLSSPSQATEKPSNKEKPINKVDGNKDASLIPRYHYTKNVIHLFNDFSVACEEKLYKNDEKVT